MTRSKTFEERLVKEMQAFAKIPRSKSKRDIFFQRIFAHLLGETIPGDNLPLKRLSQKERYLFKISQHHTEISDSLGRIGMSRDFLSRIPRGTKSKVNYLRYHYEFFLNEVYIWYLRVDKFLEFEQGQCQKYNMLQENAFLAKLRKSVRSSLDGVTTPRGKHVHERRYETNKMSQLSTLDLLATDTHFNQLNSSELRRFQLEIYAQVSNTYNVLEEVVEKELYKKVGSLIFSKIPSSFSKD